MRLFTAVTLGNAIEAHATATLERLHALAPRARWVQSHGVHLTLVFLGEVEEARLPELGEVLRPISLRHTPFTLSIEGGGSFGVPRHPHVLWAGVGGETAALEALQDDMAAALEPLGFPRDKRLYTAHLTLARSKDSKGDAAFVACVQALEGNHWGEARVEHFTLFESKAGQYLPRLELPLAGGT
ncbi:RNA 2',3'-cyclic phosphodiesterase [Stigmatella sp. ncwal1]|uniref:RNA 2',3'-cyclic phosphodiesterase n=1 Tax=Stigmatella ashevillensis TaxID=2995309 RepID=A0ABT5DH98_9BACT|nr:RNA 2',3'-cyclic phosphodiesterase [Stigmatella ashevillena]MDC0713051.1 RNA 2',3'-cyclic phosphodiesterase [Stigmatella ashevillena]